MCRLRILCDNISERSTREKKRDNKLTRLVLLHRGEVKMKHNMCYYHKYDKYKELLPTNHRVPQ